MNLTDLRDVLDERSATDHAEARSHLILDGVYDRLEVRRKRRRAATTVTSGVGLTVVVIAAFAMTPPSGSTPPTTLPWQATPSATVPSPTGVYIEGFAEYANGAKVIAAASVPTPTRTVSVVFVPTSLDLGFFTRCEGNGDYVVAVNGKQFSSGTGCGSAYLSTTGPLGKQYGVTVGEPSTATFSVTADSGSLALAVGQNVAPADYRFPPRPQTLRPIEHPDEERRMAYLTQEDMYAGDWGMAPDSRLWNKAQSAYFPWGEPIRVKVQAQTPGAMTVKVNGVEVLSHEWWDYEQGRGISIDSTDWKESYGLDLKKGDPITLTVTPTRMTGDWYVHVQHAGTRTTTW
jgi:hypothetical protein